MIESLLPILLAFYFGLPIFQQFLTDFVIIFE